MLSHLRRCTFLFVLLFLPLPLFAEEGTLTRADGFVLLWQPLKRSIEENREKPFSDVPENHSAFAVLTFAKSRGILEESAFYPNEPLRLNDALICLLRTRNVAPPDDISYDTLGGFVERYDGLQGVTGAFGEQTAISRETLQSLMNALDSALREELHEVSFYAEEFEGDGTAFGEKFNPKDFTDAHKTLPYNTLVKVRHPESGKNVVVRINDRGPYVDGRDMDLSLAAFEALTTRSAGILRGVTFERLGSAEIVNACPEPTYQRRLGRTLLSPGIPRTLEKGTHIALSGNSSFRLIQMRSPGSQPLRPSSWTGRDETLELSFEKLGQYSFVFIGDDGRRRRFQTKVTDACGA